MNGHKTSFPHSPMKLFSFFLVGVFFIFVSSVLIFSARGYKLELNGFNFSFKKTGTIIVTSQPSGADILVNGKLSKYKSGMNLFPTSLKDLFGGKYTLKLNREGYLPWQKTLEVVEEAVTWANYIVLFPEKPIKETIFEENILLAKQAEDNSKMFLVSSPKEGIINLYGIDSYDFSKTKYLTITNEADKPKTEIQDFSLSHDNSRVLIHQTIDGLPRKLVLNLRDFSTTDVTDLFKFSFDKLSWNAVDSDELLGLKEGNIYKISLFNKTISAALMDKVITFESERDRALYALRNIDEGISLWRSDLSGNDNRKIVKSLPKSKDYKIKYSPANGRILIVIDGDVKTVYMADKLTGQLELTQLSQESTDAFWSPNGRRILIRNEKNAWVYDIEREKEYQTITNEEIKYLRWDDGNDHVVANITGEYRFIEFDGGYPIKIGNSLPPIIFFSGRNQNYFYISSDKETKGKLMVYKRQ